MATSKQKKAINNIVENRGNVSKAMRDAGYSPNSAKNPSNLLDSKGFMELMDQYGLTDTLIVEALVNDINAKPKNRVPELQLAVKMRGRMMEKVDHTSNGKPLTFIVTRGSDGEPDSKD